MAKKKHNSKGSGVWPFKFLSNLSLPERAKSLVLSIVMFSLALVFVFAFFGKAGAAGAFFFRAAEFLMGRGVFLLPLFFVLGGLVFLGMKTYRAFLVFFTLLMLLVGVAGIFGTLARTKNLEIQEISGWVGFMVSWPVFAAFGFWVSEILFGAVSAAAIVIVWQVLPHELGESSTFAKGATERIKKIFEPKFQVTQVEQEPKVQTAAAESGRDEKLKAASALKIKPAESLLGAGGYEQPPLELLEPERGLPNAGDIKTYSAIIKKTLNNFDIPVEISEVNIGPAVTQYAFKPAEGIKLSRITALQNDLSLALAAHPLRVEAPIPGRALVGIEVPNKTRAVVRLRGMLEHRQWKDSLSPLLISLGRDVSGNPVYADLAKMPHLLLAGATGSGKTIGLNNIIIGLVYRNSPSNVRFILVDPKRVEFPVYNDLPHLLTPVIFDTQRTLNVLKWLTKEMERRFAVFSETRVRDIAGYHVLAAEQKKKGSPQVFDPEVSDRRAGTDMEEMPYLVTILDELADLMAARGKELEGMIVRLAQMARAVGIHLILATQRPSVEIITGLIKANITSRVAFQVASQIDSRTILDAAGAEKLLGLGDMLFVSAEFTKPRRIQGVFVSDKEVKKVVDWLARAAKDVPRRDIVEDELAERASDALQEIGLGEDQEDLLYEEAKRVVIEAKRASASLLQRRLRIGYARAARLLDILEERGVVGPGEGAKPREVYAPRLDDQEQGQNSPWVSP